MLATTPPPATTTATGVGTANHQQNYTTRIIQIRSRNKTSVATATSNNAAANTTSTAGGAVILPPTVRPDGTTRKPVKVRAGWVPPEDIPAPVTPPVPSVVVTAPPQEEDEEIDILNDDDEDKLPTTPPPLTTSSASSLASTDQTTLTPGAKVEQARPPSPTPPGTRLLDGVNTYNNKILPGLLEDKSLLDEDQEDGTMTPPTSVPRRENKRKTPEEDEEGNKKEIESIFKQSAQNILQEINKHRKIEGCLLLKAIAKQYGLRITIHDDPTTTTTTYSDSFYDYSTAEEDSSYEDEQRKRRRLSPVLKDAIRQGRQVRIRRVQGAIGYRRYTPRFDDSSQYLFSAMNDR